MMSTEYTSRDRRRRRRERGGAAAIVAMMLGTGVFFGVSALALDVGSIWWERRQLQNGADAAAIALAAQCASSPASCSPTSPVIANYANKNAADGATSNDGVCGRFSGTGFTPGTAFTACPSASDSAITEFNKTRNLAECLPLPAQYKVPPGSNAPYVEVRVGTGTGSSPSPLQGFFSKAITGSDNPHVTACARAAWGPVYPKTQNVLNITISECDWKNQTGYTGPGTATYPAGPTGPAPGYTVGTWPSTEHKVYTKGNPTSCDTSSPGGTAPGGFAALSAAAGCQSTLTLDPVTGDTWAKGDPGSDLPCSEAQLLALRGTVVYLPVFDCLTNSIQTITATTNCSSGLGSNNWYHIGGYAAFYLAGWHLASTQINSIRPPHAAACTGGDRCLVGWFLADTVASVPGGFGGGGTAPNYGLTGVWSAG